MFVIKGFCSSDTHTTTLPPLYKEEITMLNWSFAVSVLIWNSLVLDEIVPGMSVTDWTLTVPFKNSNHSTFVIVSVPSSPFDESTSATVTVLPVIEIVYPSMSPPKATVSEPALPSMVSSPPPPVMVSSPAPPIRTSSPTVPTMGSSTLFRLMVRLKSEDAPSWSVTRTVIVWSWMVS